MKAKILLLLTLTILFLPAVGLAQTGSESTQQLVVWLNDGTKVYHDLADEPVTTFENGALYINSAKVSISYPIERVLRYTYEGVMTSISSPTVRSGEIHFSQGEDEMKFDGIPAGTRLEVYSSDGRLLSVQYAPESGHTAVVSLKSFPAGTYILKAGDASYKFLKK